VPDDAALSRRLSYLIFFSSFIGPAAAQDGNLSSMFDQQMEQARRALAVGLDERAKRVATQEVPAPRNQQGDVNNSATTANPASPLVQSGERISAHWWVILGSYPEGASGLDDESRRITAAAGRCGVRPMRDHSSHYEGFAPGYTVLVVGAQPSRASAQKF
jgi:hypothetical protein